MGMWMGCPKPILCGPCTALPTPSKVSTTVSGVVNNVQTCCAFFNATFVATTSSSGSCHVCEQLLGSGDACKQGNGNCSVLVAFFLSGGTVWIRVSLVSTFIAGQSISI